ncbi:diguanylate cyclase (GGDEF)-like protein [Metabacillus crassostreae]|uniref:sensor domain-containing diguanylate cyclase n=1 Tax=Metabacillus crassostreae TaxID=929098 RepID=UPI001958FF41|nr:sensor domain-containing diguanylate cyclase [Metabacillus crassostreae]MBM7603064.1 diguanylate cyclase (GGDEF)-like protein [Metabacillus crassostreae]
MRIPIDELQLYKDFDELAFDILDMAKEYLPDRLIFLSSFTEEQQFIVKVSEARTDIHLKEGMAFNLNGTICNRINFDDSKPLIFEDMSKETCLDDLRESLKEININSYLGIPVILGNGEVFGTLCAVHKETRNFNERSIKMLQRIAKMFSFYIELERNAYRDFLTGLYNRQFLFKYFNEHSRNSGVLFFIDLDGFKKINDALGHDMGDQVLKEVGLKLGKYVDKKNGIAVRLGGDEFVVSLSNISIDDTSKQADYLLSLLSSWGNSNAKEFKDLSASIGIMPYTEGDNLELLLKNADKALYMAKKSGKNQYRYYIQ